MLKVISYKWTACEDFGKPNNNYADEIESITTDGETSFVDILQDNGIKFEQQYDTYYIIDVDGNRTGEAYLILN